MSFEMDNFNDPELKKALARALPKASAPASLRMSIERGMERMSDSPPADEPLTQPNPWHISNWFPARRRLAVAAAIAGLGLGIGLFVASEHAGNQPGMPMASNDPVIVQGALVRHDQILASMERGGDQFRRSLLTIPQVRERVPRDVSLPVSHPDLSSEGWQFVGAQPCEMGKCCGAQLVYSRGAQTLSIFVFAAGQISPEMVAACRARENHVTAYKPAGNAALLVVASCPSGRLSQQEVSQLAARLSVR